jgi:hypothetical protein
LIAFAIITVFLVLVGWGIVQILDFCQGGKC